MRAFFFFFLEELIASSFSAAYPKAMKVRPSKILVGILSLAVIAAATVAGREYARHLKLEKFHQEQREKYVQYLEQCVSREAGISGIVDAEREFLRGRKELIQLWTSGYVSESYIPNFIGDESKVTVRSASSIKALNSIPVTPNIEARTCLVGRYVDDYNLTMLRLLGIRKIGQTRVER